MLHAGNHQRLTRMNTNIHPNFAKNIFQDNAVTEPSVEFNEPVVAAPPRSNADIVAEQNAPVMARCFGPETKGEAVKLNDARVPAVLMERWAKQQPCPEHTACVHCGPQSGGLCALVFFEANAYHAFLRANPGLANTLWSNWAGVYYIWLRLPGWAPANDSAPGMLWVSSGLVPVFNLVPEEAIAPYVPDKKVLQTTYAAVQWPKAFEKSFFIDHTIFEFGPLIQPVKNTHELNHAALARILPRMLELYYDQDAQGFVMRRADKPMEVVTTDAVTRMVMDCLLHHLKMEPGFPMNKLNATRVKALIEEIKIVVGFRRPSAAAWLKEFVHGLLCLKAGGNLTVEEIHGAYLRHGRAQDSTLFPRSKFLVELPRTILATFNLTRVNNVLRPVAGTARWTARRGFNGVAFKSDGGDSKDGGDGADGGSIATSPPASSN